MSEEKSQESPATNTGTGSVSTTTDLIERGNQTAERLERIHSTLKAEGDRIENMLVKASLGGRSDAGSPMKEKTPDEIAQEKADKVLKMYGYKR